MENAGIEKPMLTPEKAWTLFFNSFLFSQGDSGLQSEIFSWLHFSYPQWQLTKTHIAYIAEVAPEKIGKYFAAEKQHSPQSDETIRNATAQEIANFQDVFLKDVPDDKNAL